MGQTCGGCCAVDVAGDVEGRPSVKGQLGVDDQIMRLVKVQAQVRGFLCRRRFKIVKKDPSQFQLLFRNYNAKAASRPFKSDAAQQLLKKLGEFRYEDQQSEKMLTATGITPKTKETQEMFVDHQLMRYTGEWAGSNKHGRGCSVLQDGSVYEGYWIQNKKNGYGRYVHPDGDLYIGYWKDDFMNGVGTYRHADGAEYQGEWQNDLHHGMGKETWEDGAIYEGEYQSGKKHGTGRFTWQDGSTFEGNFVLNKMEGTGTYQWTDGRKYTGDWKDNMMHGFGVFTFEDERVYRGQYINDKKEGQGVFEWPDGRRYEGGWLDGKQHGKSTYINAKGVVKVGIWEHGKRIEWVDSGADAAK